MNEQEIRSGAAKEKAEETMEKMRSMGQQGKEKAKEAYETAKEKIQKTVKDIRGKSFDQVVDDVSGYIKDNPGRFLLITLGIGIAAGMMLRGNRHNNSENSE